MIKKIIYISTKGLFFILLTMVIVGKTKAQTKQYEKVLKTDSTSWVSYHHELFGLMKDSVYVETIEEENNLYIKYWVGFLRETYFVGTLREENGRLWITYSDFPNNERLIFDMNLEVGDVFVFDVDSTISATVQEVRYEDQRKIIVFDRISYFWFDEPIMFIEGVGRNVMTFEYGGGPDRNYQSCKYDALDLAFSTSNPYFENCEFLTTSVSQFTDHQLLEVYPNPAKNSFKINPNDSQQPYVIKVFNSNGFLVKTMQGIGETIIPSEHLKNGLYLLEIIGHDKIFNERIIINK